MQNAVQLTSDEFPLIKRSVLQAVYTVSSSLTAASAVTVVVDFAQPNRSQALPYTEMT